MPWRVDSIPSSARAGEGLQLPDQGHPVGRLGFQVGALDEIRRLLELGDRLTELSFTDCGLCTFRGHVRPVGRAGLDFVEGHEIANALPVAGHELEDLQARSRRDVPLTQGLQQGDTLVELSFGGKQDRCGPIDARIPGKVLLVALEQTACRGQITRHDIAVKEVDKDQSVGRVEVEDPLEELVRLARIPVAAFVGRDLSLPVVGVGEAHPRARQLIEQLPGFVVIALFGFQNRTVGSLPVFRQATDVRQTGLELALEIPESSPGDGRRSLVVGEGEGGIFGDRGLEVVSCLLDFEALQSRLAEHVVSVGLLVVGQGVGQVEGGGRRGVRVDAELLTGLLGDGSGQGEELGGGIGLLALRTEGATAVHVDQVGGENQFLASLADLADEHGRRLGNLCRFRRQRRIEGVAIAPDLAQRGQYLGHRDDRQGA